MDYSLAVRLKEMLIRACPVDSGALKESITIVQYNEKEFVIQIGNESGEELNDRCATNVYASITNDAKQLRFHTKKSENLLIVKPNPNYHWVNKTVESWIQENKLKLAVSTDELEEEEELE